MTPTDSELMAQVRKRDEHAFDALLFRYRAMLRRHLLSIVRDPVTADDLLQEVWLRLWTRSDQWTAGAGVRPGRVKAWLFRIATNLALNHLRSVHRRREQPLEIPADLSPEEDDSPLPAWMIDASAPGPDALLELTERRAHLRRLINDLPEEKREVFRLVHDAEMDLREVAEALGIPEGTVKSRLFHARKRLAQEWSEQEGVL